MIGYEYSKKHTTNALGAGMPPLRAKYQERHASPNVPRIGRATTTVGPARPGRAGHRPAGAGGKRAGAGGRGEGQWRPAGGREGRALGGRGRGRGNGGLWPNTTREFGPLQP